METPYTSIPLPNFKFSDIVDKKVKTFCITYFKGPIFNINGVSERVQNQLWELNTNEDRIQFLTYLINKTTEGLSEYLKKYPTANSHAEVSSQEVLYYLYGKISEYGFNVDIESFSGEEIIKNNSIINDLNQKLEEIKMGQQIIYDDLNEKINILINNNEDLKGLYILGKKKWYLQLGGIVLENIVDKEMEEVLKLIKPYLIQMANQAVRLVLS